MRIVSLITILSLSTFGATQADGGSTLFAIDVDTQTVVEFDAATGAVLGSIPTPDVATGADGLATSGASLFFANAGTDLVYEIDPATGANLSSFLAPSVRGGTDGLAFDGGTLFTVDGAGRTVFRVDLATGEVVGSCASDLALGGALAAENGRLFSTVGLMSIVEIDPVSCEVLGGPFAAPDGDLVLGLAFDGKDLFASTFIGESIFTLDPATGAVVDSFRPGFAASGLASSAAVVSPTLAVRIDIRPNSCDNPLNVRSDATVHVVVLGTPELDAARVDVSSIRLEGVAPRSWELLDRLDPEDDCSRSRPDGVLDLGLKFDAEMLVEALAEQGVPLATGVSVTLRLEGSLVDGTAFTGEDDVVLSSHPIKDSEALGLRKKGK